MNITKRSRLTNMLNTRDIDVTFEELDEWDASGAHIQDRFPYLSNDDREFLISGFTPDDWKCMFGGGR